MILIDPPLEEYQRRTTGINYPWTPWDFEEVRKGGREEGREGEREGGREGERRSYIMLLIDNELENRGYISFKIICVPVVRFL